MSIFGARIDEAAARIGFKRGCGVAATLTKEQLLIAATLAGSTNKILVPVAWLQAPPLSLIAEPFSPSCKSVSLCNRIETVLLPHTGL